MVGDLSRDGFFVLMQVLEHATDQDRALATYTDRINPCSVPTISVTPIFETTPGRSWRLARVSDGSAREVRNFEGTLGDAILRRTDSGSLVAEVGDVSRELLPASCGAHVLYSDRADDTIAVVCRGEANSLEVLHRGRRIHTGCKVQREGDSAVTLRGESSSVEVTCADAPPDAEAGFLSLENPGSVSILTRHQTFERPLLSEMGSPWTLHKRSVLPGIHSPEVELCSSHPVIDMETGWLKQPNQRAITPGTTSGLVLGAAGASSERRDAHAIGPLFWVAPTDPGARCASWEEIDREFERSR